MDWDRVLVRGQERAQATVRLLGDLDSGYQVRVTGPFGELAGEGTAKSPFAALQPVRFFELEPRGWYLAMHGARLDTWPPNGGSDDTPVVRVLTEGWGVDVDPLEVEVRDALTAPTTEATEGAVWVEGEACFPTFGPVGYPGLLGRAAPENVASPNWASFEKSTLMKKASAEKVAPSNLGPWRSSPRGTRRPRRRSPRRTWRPRRRSPR